MIGARVLGIGRAFGVALGRLHVALRLTSCKQLFNWRFRGHHAVASDIRVRVRSGILQQFLAIKRQQHWLDRTPEAGLEIVLPVG